MLNFSVKRGSVVAAVVLSYLMLAPVLVSAQDIEVGHKAYDEGDYTRAFNEYQRLALQGNAPAQHALAYLYQAGQGVPQDYEEAMRLYRLAADQGYVSSQVNIGQLYYDGQGVPQDYTEAMRWYRMAADQGEFGAQYQLGEMYSSGLGVPQDRAEAIRWYRMAADQGYAPAQFTIGFSYSNGLELPQDDAKAEHWYRLAAEQGHEMAKRALANMGVSSGSTEVANGTKVPASEIMAYCLKVSTLGRDVAEQIASNSRVSVGSVSLIKTYGITECWGTFDTDKGPMDRRIVGIRRDGSGIYYVDIIL